MNEKLQEALANSLEKSLTALEKGGQWALDTAPELVQQFLMWELWSSVFLLVFFGIIPLIIGLKIGFSMLEEFKLPKEKNSYIYDYCGELNAKGAISSIAIGICTISALFGIGVNGYNIIHILVAPDIYLIKELLHLM